MTCRTASGALWRRPPRRTFCSEAARSRVRGLVSGEQAHVRPVVGAEKAAVDKQLREGERSTVVAQDAVYSVEANQVAANNPIEDYYAAGKCVPSSAWLFGVFDGHAGASCSRHVASRLLDYICASMLRKHLDPGAQMPIEQRLQWLFSSSESRLPEIFREQHLANVQSFHRAFLASADMSTVRKALQGAFLALDEDISNGAMPDREGRVSRAHAAVATAGSCAIVAHIMGPHLHIANVGDSAAVLGVCGANGSWSARQLSREHCTDNPDEVKRIRTAHPAREANSVLKNGRLLGQLFPLRAFGDVRFKWTAELQNVVLSPIYGKGATPPGLDTPPYLTAAPDVYYHRLTANDRFLVLASDGVWEWLQPETVVRLVSDHMLGAQTLNPYQPGQNMTLRQIMDDLNNRKAGVAKRPIDENCATHLIRHAIGGTTGTGGTEMQYRRLVESLQLPPGVARDVRDDMTITVIFFDQNYLSDVGDKDDTS
uniref:PPM-type phosphatase domain-containing protein n=1 Tax=Plectus sambesii TaxID=2011161 RepID=A0A914WC94_9BILA